MKCVKRVVAKLLVFAFIVTSIDVSWYRPGDITQVFASIGGSVTDTYDAFDDLSQSMSIISADSSKIANQMNVVKRSDTDYNTNATAGVTDTDFKQSNNHVVGNGLYTFNQLNLQGTGQVKSGNWLNDTQYEAMVGTPTTQPLFVTMGGTQWIVDMQYRFVTAPYVREYHFDAHCANYRYYKLGEGGSSSAETIYKSQMIIPFNVNPNKWSKFKTVEGSTRYNWAYTFFEHNPRNPAPTQDWKPDVEGDLGPWDKYIVNASFTDMTGESHNIQAYVQDKWVKEDGSFSKDKVAPLKKVVGTSNNVNSDSSISTDSSFVTPNVATAILVKQQVAKQIINLRRMYSERDDNYRADQGTYDIDNDDLDGNNDIDDELTFMYTYDCLARFGTINGNERASKGDQSFSKSFLTPSFVSYIYDWDQYKLMNGMDKTYGSDTVRLKKLPQVYTGNSDTFYKSVVKSIQNGPGSTGRKNYESHPEICFPLYVEDFLPLAYNSDTVLGLDGKGISAEYARSDKLKADLDIAKIVSKRAGTDVCIAISEYENLLAYGAPFNGDGYPSTNLTSADSNMNGAPSDLYEKGGWIDMPVLYYRALYSLLLNYGCLFYHDELAALLGYTDNTDCLGPVAAGLPPADAGKDSPSNGVDGIGFPVGNNDVEGASYDERVNHCLAAVFGSPLENSLSETTYIPFACFPKGGDLDGYTEDDNLYNKNSNGESYSCIDNTSISRILMAGVCRPSYLNCVKIQIDISVDYSDSPGHIDNRDYYKTHHVGDIINGNEGVSPYTGGYYCIGSRDDSCVESSWDGSTHKEKCTACAGTGLQADGVTACAACSGTKKVNCTQALDKCDAGIATGGEDGKHYYTDVNLKNSATWWDHQDRKYVNTYKIRVEGLTIRDTQLGGLPCQWVDDPKDMQDIQTLEQKFNNVQWLSLDSFCVWQMHHGEVKGLASMLAQPISGDNIASKDNDILVSKAVDQLGFVYRKGNDPVEVKTAKPFTDSHANGTTFVQVKNNLSNLESLGRVANSYRLYSAGNCMDPKEVFNEINNPWPNNTGKVYKYQWYYKKGDVPILDKTWINNNYHAYKFKGSDPNDSGDVLSFEYNPYAQGGRSHSTFYGFVSQALANTLYFKDSSTGYYRASECAIGYGNSLRVQGDYLTLDKTDGKTLTMMGMFYNTWDERFSGTNWSSDESSYKYSSGKFSLVPSGFNRLTIYLSTCNWIPARLSVIFTRQPINRLRQEGCSISRFTDQWTIHSYCDGINGETHTPWDACTDEKINEDCLGYNCFAKCTGERNRTDKGSVNPYFSSSVGGTGEWYVDHKDVNIVDADNLHATGFYYMTGEPIQISPGVVVKLHTLLLANKEYYRRFKVLDCNGNVVSGETAVNVKAVSTNPVLEITLNHYLAEGMNTPNIMTAGVSRNGYTELERNMPYLGYQSVGNGTQDINLNGGGNKQKGYDTGKITYFGTESSKDVPAGAGAVCTFVSDNPYDGGFERFGITPSGDNKPITVSPKVNGNKRAGADAFSAKYPWLADLNVNRYLANNYYKVGQAGIVYKKVLSVGRNNQTHHSAKDGSQSDNDAKTLEFHTNYIRVNDSNSQPDGGATHGGGTSGADGYLNSLVIFNPVSTQSAHIMTPTEYMPDAANTESSSWDRTRYLTYVDEHCRATRDTRLEYKYVFKNHDSYEQYLTGTGIESVGKKTTSIKHWEMLDVSQVATAAYHMNDYDAHTSTDTAMFETDVSKVIEIEKTGTYNITHKETNEKWVSCKVALVEGDKIKFSEKKHAVVLTMGTNDFELPWKSFTDAYKQLQTTTANDAVKNWPESSMSSGLPLYKDMYISAGFNTITRFRRGSLMRIQLTVSDTYTDGYKEIADAIELDAQGMDNFDIHADTSLSNISGGKATYTWYLEAKSDCYLYNVGFKVKNDCFLWASDNILQSEDVVLMCLGDGTPVVGATSYGFFHENLGYSESTATIQKFYNNYVVDIRGEAETDYYSSMIEAGYYISMESTTNTISLKSEALDDPHRVPNSDWRFYVVGWKTAAENTIMRADDQRLFQADTVLECPIGGGKTITVGELIDKANHKQLGVYQGLNGSYGLIDLNADRTFTRKSEYTGYEITEGTFKTIQFGDDELEVHEGKAFECTPNGPFDAYGLNQAGLDKTKHAFECVFVATTHNDLAVWAAELTVRGWIAYDVAFSHYTGHRYSTSSDVDINLITKDWESKETEVYAFTGEAYNAVFANTLSLDDEYTIYWDNLGDLVPGGEGSASNLRLTSQNLGRGWDTVGSNKNAVTPKPVSDFDGCKDSDYWNGIGVGTSVTDTTPWIYSKYVIFNVDMYAFTTGNSFTYDDATVFTQHRNDWNPTTPAFKADGMNDGSRPTPNNIVYIPAGEKVYLGYYDGDSGVTDDAGHFVDYGASSGQKYVYHFWVPLSVGEADQTVTTQFVVNGFNGVMGGNGGTESIAAGNTLTPIEWTGTFPTYNTVVGNNNPCSTAIQRVNSPGVDEWRNAIIDAYGAVMDNNVRTISGFTYPNTKDTIITDLVDCYTRSGNAISSQTVSVVGRVGGLTVMDSGDPRYQDTFKLPDDTADKTAEGYYAVAPIVVAIKRYSNVKGEAGSQRKYLFDYLDVRGRVSDVFTSYTVAHKSRTLDTYADASWVRKDIDINNILPMTSEFNIHPELRSSLTTNKLGYELYCSLDTIGNYYGSSGRRPTSDVNQSADVLQDVNDYVNNNLDYGQTKVQIRPMYVLYNAKTGEFCAADVYMRKGNSYSLINAGSLYASEDADKQAHNGATTEKYYYLDHCFDATYTSDIATNTGGIVGDKYVLDQNMLRRSITDIESDITYDVVHKFQSAYSAGSRWEKLGITTSLLDSNTYGVDELGGKGLDYSYIYGNAQMLFLREYNRTFFGGRSDILNQHAADDFQKTMLRNARKYAQRWYFGLGLPSSSVFVPHDSVVTENTIVNKKEGWYVLCLIDVYSVGEKWAIHYESPVSGVNVTIGNNSYSKDKWNVYRETTPYAIPVCIYDLSQTTAAGDRDTRGSH